MNARIARTTAWSLVIIYFILAGTGLFFQVLTKTTPGDVSLPITLFIVMLTVVGIWPIIGALVVMHHPRHPVGWLLFATFPVVAIDMFSIGYASHASSISSGPMIIPGAILIWLNWSGLPFVTFSFTLMNLLFPSGKLRSARWRYIALASFGALIVYLCLQTVEPGPLALFPGLENPYAVGNSDWATFSPFYWGTVAILVLCSLASVISLILRLSQSKGSVRQQLRWMAVPATFFWFGIPFGFLAEYDPSGLALVIGVGLPLISVPAIVIAVAFSIFKFRLYDINILINRTLVYGALSACVIGLYILIVGGASFVIRTNLDLLGLMITTILVGVIYRPVLSFFQRRVDRLLPPFLSGEETKFEDQARSTVHHHNPDQNKVLGWERALKSVWILAAAISVAILIASLPGYLERTPIGNLGDHLVFEPTPLILVFHHLNTLISIFSAVLSLSLAGLLFIRKSGDRMGMFLSFYLLAQGILLAGPIEMLERFFPNIAWINSFILLPLFLGPGTAALIGIFPDGRFVPGWSRWLIPATLLIMPSQILMQRVGFLPGFGSFGWLSTGFVIILSIGIFIALLYVLIYRYRYVSTKEQRQQTKWVVYGLFLFFLLILLSGVPWTIVLSLPPGSYIPWWLPASQILWFLSTAILPITLTVAILRYRLYEIDLLINRSLVYGALTGSVIAIYGLVVGAFGVLFQTGGNLVLSLLATGLVAVLFQPLRARLHRGINRMMYGERDDPATVFARLGDLLEASASKQEILPGLVRTIAQTLKLPYVAIELGQEGKRQIVAAYGDLSGEPERFSLVYQAEEVGCLVAATRREGEELTGGDRQLLDNIARQAGAVAHAVHLTNELQRSRLRLVTAREEERRRLRRDLHDELGPQLASQTLIIEALEKRLHKDPASAARLLEELKKQSQLAVQDIRQIVYGLRPPALDQLGLIGAVKEALAVYQQSGVTFNLQANEKIPVLPAAVEVAAYRIIQEAATNVIRHARAKYCWVRLDYKEREEIPEIRLEIKDDGIGFQDNQRNGVGLSSMRERAAELGGHFKIAFPSEGGTNVSVRLPIPTEET